MAAEAAKPTSSADSYIGSLISLTSKSEIRYEGILYSIDTDESSIGLRNVRSFGTEGRKKDGPQVAPSDKVYEYILFRGSDIKDLQVKSSPPVQTSSSSAVDNDPAIIQSHYPRPASTSSNLPSAVSSSSTDVSAHAPQLGHLGSNFQGALPLYQPGGNLGSWGPSPPPGANGSGLAMPMYWPGFYGPPPNGLPHLPQQTLLRPPSGLSVPPSLQQPMQFSGFNPSLSGGGTNLPGSKLPEIPASLVPSSSTSTTLTSTSSTQLNLPPVQSANLASETPSSSVVPKALNSVLLTPNFPSVSPLTMSSPDVSAIVSAASKSVSAVPSSSFLNLSISQAAPSIINSAPSQKEISTPSLVTPDQLLQSGQTPISSSPSQEVHKDVEVVQVSSSSSSSVAAPKVQAVKEAQPPILPLPPASRAFHKPSGAPYQRNAYHYRGHERGRGSGTSRSVARFTEDFDFEAMNEKFKKDEVWGHLGKSNKSHVGNMSANGGDGSEEEGEEELPKIEVKPVYNKDDFFDTLSCNTLDHDSQNGRPKFSEQLKIDAETFGDFVRYRGGRGGRGPFRGGRGRGSYHGRGYGYSGRGRGRGMHYNSS